MAPACMTAAERRAEAPSGQETVEAYKKRLRLTALRLPSAFLRKATDAIPGRMQQVIEAKGGNISCD